MLENIEDMSNDTVTTLLLKNTKTMLDMFDELNQHCHDRSFNASNLAVKQSVGMTMNLLQMPILIIHQNMTTLVC